MANMVLSMVNALHTHCCHSQKALPACSTITKQHWPLSGHTQGYIKLSTAGLISALIQAGITAHFIYLVHSYLNNRSFIILSATDGHRQGSLLFNIPSIQNVTAQHYQRCHYSVTTALGQLKGQDQRHYVPTCNSPNGGTTTAPMLPHTQHELDKTRQIPHL